MIHDLSIDLDLRRRKNTTIISPQPSLCNEKNEDPLPNKQNDRHIEEQNTHPLPLRRSSDTKTHIKNYHKPRRNKCHSRLLFSKFSYLGSCSDVDPRYDAPERTIPGAPRDPEWSSIVATDDLHDDDGAPTDGHRDGDDPRDPRTDHASDCDSPRQLFLRSPPPQWCAGS